MADKDDIGSSEPDGMDPEMEKIQVKKKKRGGKVHGAMPRHRLDKRARGGSADKWMAKAVPSAHKGKFTQKADAAGKTVHAYAEEKKHSAGTLGKEARLAETFEKEAKK